MRVTALSLLTFYVVFNVSLYLVSGGGNANYQIIPYSLPAYESPANIQRMLIGAFISAGVGFIITWILGRLVLGGTVAIILFALQFFVGSDSVFYWVFYGLPAFIDSAMLAAGVDAVVATMFNTVALTITSVVWFWFIISMLTGRTIEQ